MLNDRIFRPVSQCIKSLDFHPRQEWSQALPVLSWQGLQLCGFERVGGMALDLFEFNGCTWMEAFLSCHPELGLGELARLLRALPENLRHENSEKLFAEFGLRWCERLEQTLQALVETPREFQTWVDEKSVGARELAPLLALPDVRALNPFLSALVKLNASKSQAVQALEWVVELTLLDRPLNDLLPSGDSADLYLRQLEKWRRPRTSVSDERWRQVVGEWPWPAQVQGHWQRFGDQAGLEIKIRTTSPQDFNKKLERLLSIRDTWSSNS